MSTDMNGQPQETPRRLGLLRWSLQVNLISHTEDDFVPWALAYDGASEVLHRACLP